MNREDTAALFNGMIHIRNIKLAFINETKEDIDWQDFTSLLDIALRMGEIEKHNDFNRKLAANGKT